MIRIIEGRIITKLTEGKQKLLRVSERFELSRFELLRVNYSKGMKEIQGKSTLVRVKVRKNGQQKTCNLSCNTAAKRVE